MLESLKEQVREQLGVKGYVVDSMFEMDDEVTWIGVYARPKDKPTALDPRDEEEARWQDEHRVNGMVQDFTEWFEWEVKDGKLVSDKK